MNRKVSKPPQTFLLNCARFPMIAATPLYKQGKRIYDYIYSTYLKPSDAILEHPKFNSNKDTVVYMAWHPHQDILAIVDKHDDVYIYEKHDTVWTCQVLRDIQMKDVTALEWKHRSAGTLAVGCKQGVCVWTIPRVATDQEPQFHPSASMVYFHLLAVGSAVSNALVIYDMLLKRTHVLKRYGHGCIMLRWSPNGEWLFEGGSIGTSRMWDTKHWESKVISNPPGLWVQAACWAPDNRSLVFSMYGKSDLHVLFMSGKQIHSVVDHPLASLPRADQAGGVIRDISLDGSRLAIAFENTPLIALYSLKQDSPLNLNTEPILFPM
ncbi:WD40-repeat-containing domain protein [Gilbertella persicaria]|uniref:WD40-repeat-containing domain protein n=1 Tax=Gilbertella persicaria TaxID=101096 RepID=UPI00221FDCE5|nr:WD40-repeat-containing domain protein [Gilbertella persicaria]KAI8086934.1 WD40-repeat-containing domain protein [Gilbertella persicaria]